MAMTSDDDKIKIETEKEGRKT